MNPVLTSMGDALFAPFAEVVFMCRALVATVNGISAGVQNTG